MLVCYKGHSSLIMLDYNGKRYTFEKNKPKEVNKEIYDYIIKSGDVEARDIDVLGSENITPVIEKVEKEAEEVKIKEIERKKRGRPRK